MNVNSLLNAVNPSLHEGDLTHSLSSWESTPRNQLLQLTPLDEYVSFEESAMEHNVLHVT